MNEGKKIDLCDNMRALAIKIKMEYFSYDTIK